MIFRISLFSLAALLLGAHFLRAGEHVLVVLCLFAPLLFLVRQRWIPLLLQLLAYGAAAVWIVQAVHLVEQRQLVGKPWLLAAAILGAVALFTGIAGALLNSRSIRERFNN